MGNLIFLFPEAQRNELFNSVEAQRNYAIVKPDFCNKSKHNLASATKFTKHNAKFAFLRFFTIKTQVIC